MKKIVILMLLVMSILSCYGAEKYAVLIAPNRPIPIHCSVRELLAVWNDMVLMYKMLLSKGYTDF